VNPLMLTKIFSAKDAVEWQVVLPAQVNVFGSVECARIYEERTGFGARLFVAQSDDGLIAYPFFLRPIQSLPFAASVTAAQWDTLTPEYTGPICRGEWSPELASFFAREFAAYCREQRIVAEFAHLHPWSLAKDALCTDGVALDREIVFVDTTRPAEELWEKHFTYACRKNIKRAQSAGVRVFPAATLDDVKEFYRIYVGTMDRRQAVSKYYFPLEYFTKFFESLPNNKRFVLAESAGQIVAATLYLHDDTDVYSYLGGADHACQNARPSNAVVFDTIRWAQGQGKKRLILGGGYVPDDGIFRFKASFSPLRAHFHIYKRIHLPDEYAALCHAWSEYYQCGTISNGYFPAYRFLPTIMDKIKL
jgi:serine/alanine adding enzyme